MKPDLAPLLAVARELTGSRIEFVLGESGLLYSLGLVQHVGDWDLTTDASLGEVQEALRNLPWTHTPHRDGLFASAHPG